MKPFTSMPVVAMYALVAASVAAAQPAADRRELVGLVRDPSGTPIGGATVEVRGASAGTNEKGAFQLWTGNIDTLTISIRRLGYQAVSALLTARNGQWDTVVVEMERTSQRLSAVNITGTTAGRANGLRDFEARRAVGNGIFVARDEIAGRNSLRTSDILRGKRGINLVRLRGGAFGVRFTSYSHSRPNCTPDIWLDGVVARELEVDDIPANDIEAMELYESMATVPFQFTPQSTTPPCGTIVIWTRNPGK